jgi:hypothetical protein
MCLIEDKKLRSDSTHRSILPSLCVSFLYNNTVLDASLYKNFAKTQGKLECLVSQLKYLRVQPSVAARCGWRPWAWPRMSFLFLVCFLDTVSRISDSQQSGTQKKEYSRSLKRNREMILKVKDHSSFLGTCKTVISNRDAFRRYIKCVIPTRTQTHRHTLNKSRNKG